MARARKFPPPIQHNVARNCDQVRVYLAGGRIQDPPPRPP